MRKFAARANDAMDSDRWLGLQEVVSDETGDATGEAGDGNCGHGLGGGHYCDWVQ